MKTFSIISRDPYLKPFQGKILERSNRIKLKIKELTNGTGDLATFANGHHHFGLQKTTTGWTLNEWAPNATSVWITGTFNHWRLEEQYRFHPKGKGNWHLDIEPDALRHLDEYKLWIEWPGGGDYRVPMYAVRVIQDPVSKGFNAQVWDPPQERVRVQSLASGESGSKVLPLMIYEAHTGMSSAEGKVSTFNEFRVEVLPRIISSGYNTLQMMAIQEHPYYGSFGYHVSGFFAVSSRFGTPDDLRLLISEAHQHGIRVIMDIVHSHSVKNTLEGPGLYDGRPGMLFHTDHRREHPAWDSLCFDYGRNETLHFLLSNCKYWLEEYGFDGFRFDGVTSMLYYDHGLGRNFSSYDAYFDAGVDEDALVYLALANELIHSIDSNAVTIAEDMSGLPGMAAPVKDGGLGFDYRLAMGIPDFWIKTLKEKPDEAWNVSEIFYELTNRRSDEKTVCYAESHDQALVGDKTIIFRLADKEMYTHMARHTESLVIDRAIALHKLIRLLTISTHGGGYLNFMGNEFGHPEWIDFPREGNNWSYHYARRQWHLADDNLLKYKFLIDFDKAMVAIFGQSGTSSDALINRLLANETDQVLAYGRNELLIVFNLNPSTSFTDYGIPIQPADYKIILNSDHPSFGGFGRIDERLIYEAEPVGKVGSGYQVKLYLPSRVGLVLRKIPIKAPLRSR